MVNEAVLAEDLMEHTRVLTRRIALTPAPAVWLNKAITMLGIEASGVDVRRHVTYMSERATRRRILTLYSARS